MQTTADLHPRFGSRAIDRDELGRHPGAGLFLSCLLTVAAFVAVVIADPFRPELPGQATAAVPSSISAPAAR